MNKKVFKPIILSISILALSVLSLPAVGAFWGPQPLSVYPSGNMSGGVALNNNNNLLMWNHTGGPGTTRTDAFVVKNDLLADIIEKEIPFINSKDLNNNADVVGFYQQDVQGMTKGFYHETSSNKTTLLEENDIQLLAVNNNKYAVGINVPFTGTVLPKAVVYNQNTKTLSNIHTSLETFAKTNLLSSELVDINNNNIAVGKYVTKDYVEVLFTFNVVKNTVNVVNTNIGEKILSITPVKIDNANKVLANFYRVDSNFFDSAVFSGGTYWLLSSLQYNTNYPVYSIQSKGFNDKGEIIAFVQTELQDEYYFYITADKQVKDLGYIFNTELNKPLYDVTDINNNSIITGYLNNNDPAAFMFDAKYYFTSPVSTITKSLSK